MSVPESGSIRDLGAHRLYRPPASNWTTFWLIGEARQMPGVHRRLKIWKPRMSVVRSIIRQQEEAVNLVEEFEFEDYES